MIFWPLLIFPRCYYWIPIFKAEVDIERCCLWYFSSFVVVAFLNCCIFFLSFAWLFGTLLDWCCPGPTIQPISLIRSLKLQRNKSFTSNSSTFYSNLFFFLFISGETFDHHCQIYNYEDYFRFRSMSLWSSLSYRSHIWIEYFLSSFFSPFLLTSLSSSLEIIYWFWVAMRSRRWFSSFDPGENREA